MKAVLVIDEMPDDCVDCPLKPLPEYEKPQDPDETWEEMHVRMGYNKCLEEIENVDG